MQRSRALRVVDADWEEPPALPSRVQQYDTDRLFALVAQQGRGVRMRRRASDGELIEWSITAAPVTKAKPRKKRRGDMSLLNEVCNKVLLLAIVVPVSLIMIGVAFRLMGVA